MGYSGRKDSFDRFEVTALAAPYLYMEAELPDPATFYVDNTHYAS